MEIAAIPQIPGIASIADVAGSPFRCKFRQSLKSLGLQASLMLLEARSGGRSQQALKSLGSQASLMLLEARSDGNPSNPSKPWNPKHP
jgi:hypothetical protein